MSQLGRAKPPTRIDIAWQVVYRLGFPLAQLWWRLWRRRHEGTLVAVHVGPSLLLLRSSYRRAWNFLGGSVRQGETPAAAARRELAEEIALVPTTPLIPVGEACGVWDGRRDRVFFFALRLDRPPELRLNNREITAAQLLSPDELDGMPLTGPVRAYGPISIGGSAHRHLVSRFPATGHARDQDVPSRARTRRRVPSIGRTLGEDGAAAAASSISSPGLPS